MAKNIDPEWRKKELSLKEVIKKYDKISPFVILKTDLQRRGIVYTDNALKAVDINKHEAVQSHIFSESRAIKPVGLLLRDGTSDVYFDTGEDRQHRDPYIIDYVDGRVVIVDEDQIIDEAYYWEKPDFYDKKTSNGVPMWQIITVRPQRIDVTPNRICHFWDKPGGGCKYCPIGAVGATRKKDEDILEINMTDLRESVAEAVKQPGRFSQIILSSGSILSGKELLDDELDLNIRALKAIGQVFKTEKFPSQLIATAYNRSQLEKLKAETGLMSYTSDIEILNKRIFDEVCPGKASFIGYEEWKNRLLEAVEVFGRGAVNTGIVSGVELSEKYGFKSEDEAFKYISEEAESLYERGVSVAQTIWNPAANTILKNDKNPSLDYLVKTADYFEKLRRKYNLGVDYDDYRRCGNHPNTDLARG